MLPTELSVFSIRELHAKNVQQYISRLNFSDHKFASSFDGRIMAQFLCMHECVGVHNLAVVTKLLS